MERLKAKTQDPLEASNLALRVLVDPGGCSGFQYRFELASRDTAGEEDVLVERGGLTVRKLQAILLHSFVCLCV